MLKFVFWALLAANALLLAYAQGYLGQPGGVDREPARLANQMAPERLIQLTAVQAKRMVDVVDAAQGVATVEPRAPVAATPAAPATPAASAPALLACVQAGPFSAADARRFETRIASLGLAERQSRIEVPFQEVTSHLVYLPPNGGREGAQRRAAELKERGVDNYFIMQGDNPLRYAISLGVFKTDGAAQKLVDQLQRQGVRGVRVLPRGPQGTRTTFQYRAIEPALRTQLAGIANNYSDASLGNCD